MADAGFSTARLPGPAWRVHRCPTDLPKLSTKDENPPNRFDDPEKKYQVRYWATNKRGAFLEVLARFRRNDETQALLRAVKKVDAGAEPDIKSRVPPGFLKELKEVQARVSDPEHIFIDVAAAETRTELIEYDRVRDALKKFGRGPELDEAAIQLGGPIGRPITQAVSRIVFDETDAVGVRYTSRLDVKEPCWAVFDFVKVSFGDEASIGLHDAELRSAADVLKLKLPPGPL